MELPEQYKNLTIEEKRIVVLNLISQFWDENVQEEINGFSDEQIDFLFTYFFTESKEEREKMWYDMQKKYEATIKDLKEVAEKLQKINLQFAELIAQQEDVEEFSRNIKKQI